MEREIFGHEKGAFTGATQTQRGKFELAGEGTIFLDEIGLLTLLLQSKLLNVLQEYSFERVGGSAQIPLRVRIISAANADLDRAAEQGAFREDLYFRLNVIRTDIPGLRGSLDGTRKLASSVVDGVGLGKDDLGDGNEGVAILQKRLNNGGQRLRRVEGGVVKQHDGAWLYMTHHPLYHFRRLQVLPVQTVTVPYRFKRTIF